MTYLRIANVFLTISAIAVAASVVLFITPGPRLSIEFAGGTLMEIRTAADTQKQAVIDALDAFTLKDGTRLDHSTVSSTKGGTFLLRMRDMTNEDHLALLTHLQSTLGNAEEMQFNAIGPTVGASLKTKSLLALGVASLAIILYLAFAFRNVPRRLNPWKFGILAVVALIHDLLITSGIFTVLSRFTTFEYDTLFVTALLTTLGYSVMDTIVIFDRIRDNINYQQRGETFEQLVTRSLKESIIRTLSTGTTALFMLIAMFFFGASSIRWFMLALIVGTLIGTYSSFFVATPLLIYWRKRD
ncbi:protein-export membrane protein SecF [Candidatus Peribacteria bacterium RIFOXYC2_FULL_58_10]|nr:MAG: protein-export membrane protein SecF [Candidatus Peribacteria bacterium RIFOXYC2_FULL_58_10]OGJ85168.1 MAG: protein-export membrane protein SecF [Candidatus Peribacteria bacterium RIFOXYD2_FULL_58_15]